MVFAAILTRVPSPPRAEAHPHESRRGYAAVFRDRPFRSFILLNTLFISASIALFSELFPVFAKNEASVSEREIGLIFFMNTALIVLAQLPVTKLQEGKRRMPALATRRHQQSTLHGRRGLWGPRRTEPGHLRVRRQMEFRRTPR